MKEGGRVATAARTFTASFLRTCASLAREGQPRGLLSAALCSLLAFGQHAAKWRKRVGGDGDGLAIPVSVDRIQGRLGHDHGPTGDRSRVDGTENCVDIAWRYDTIIGKARGGHGQEFI